MKHLILSLLALLTSAFASAEYEIPWRAETSVNAGGGDFAPYFIASNSGGVYTQPAGIYERVSLRRELSTSGRFTYGFGAEAGFSFTESTGYDRYSAASASWSVRKLRAPYAWVQQLWGGVKFRGMFLTVGMNSDTRSLFDSPLGVGDITLSGNARPIPQARIGFIDFQDIPFTRGWVQIQVEVAYGKFTDADWLRNHFNHYNSFITTGVWFHYKRCYFRTDPDRPFSVTVGMQHAAQFGGYYNAYSDGKIYETAGQRVTFRDFVDVFIQKRGSSGATGGDRQYYNGNHLGSWDFRARYRFADRSELTAYFQWPWEDGSGIGKLNGWDGVWGINYKAPSPGWVDEAQVEYIDFTNQSGPIHWAPGDHPDTSIPGQATGADNYYNNYYYDGWANYGMSVGTPFVQSPLYNRDGYPLFTDNRIRGFQAGVAGSPAEGLKYRVLMAYRNSRGTPVEPAPRLRHATSAMAEASYCIKRVKGLSVRGQIAFDAGSLTGNRYGVLLALSYDGLIRFGRK